METPYSADRTKFLDIVKTWRLSELGGSIYRDSSKRIAEGDSLVDAPWITKVDESSTEEETLPVRSSWFDETANAFEGSFDDIAETFDQDDIADLIYSISGDERIVEGALSHLIENEGKIMLLAKRDSDLGYVLQYESGAFFAAEIDELDEDLLDEKMNGIALIARTAGGQGEPNAPVVPGYVMIPTYQWNQQRLYEVLHSANVVLNGIKESGGVPHSFYHLLEFFTKDLSETIAELILDETSLTDSEYDSLYEAFAGAFAGIHEKVLAGVPDPVIDKFVTEAQKKAK